jgi:hypothetical protein
MVLFHLSDNENYQTNGMLVADYFGFVQPTRILLTYKIERNNFCMTVLPMGKPLQVKVFPNVIQIDSSDNASDDETQLLVIC